VSYITVTTISKRFGIDKSNTRKYLLKKEFEFTTVRIPETGNQKNLALTEDEAKRAYEVRLLDGYELK